MMWTRTVTFLYLAISGLILTIPIHAQDLIEGALSPFLDVGGLVEEKTEGYDISIKFGSATGYVIQAPKAVDLDPKKTAFAGNVIAAAYNMHFSRKVSMILQAQLLLDSISAQVVRQGAGLGVAYHLLGGVRRKTDQHQFATFVRRNTFNLSLVGRISLQNYAASAKSATAEGISGAVMEVTTGGEFRYDLTEGHALGFEAVTTTYSLPASVERLTPRVQELIGFWRFFI